MSDDQLSETISSRFPKILQLDPEDIKAVRSFLPGKILGRTAALLALAVLALAYAGLADKFLRRIGVDLSPTPWLHYGLLFGLPIAVVMVQMFFEELARRRRLRLQRLAVRPGVEQSAYFRIGPYLSSPEDRARFNRADRAHEKVLAWIERSAGVMFAALGPAGPLGFLSQTFSDTAGQTLQITYFLASNGSTPNEFETLFNGNTFKPTSQPPALHHLGLTFSIILR